MVTSFSSKKYNCIQHKKKRWKNCLAEHNLLRKVKIKALLARRLLHNSNMQGIPSGHPPESPLQIVVDLFHSCVDEFNVPESFTNAACIMACLFR